MRLTVGQLIKELKRYPKDSLVGIADFDTDASNRLSGVASSVSSFDPDTSFDPDFCKSCYVVISYS